MPTAKTAKTTAAAATKAKVGAPTVAVVKGKKKMAKPTVDQKGTRVGVVESDKRHQTRKVVVNYMSQHPKYGKYIRQRTVLQVHDEVNASKTGDVVEVAPCRPVSKSKTWTLVRVVEQRSDQAAALASAKTLAVAE